MINVNLFCWLSSCSTGIPSNSSFPPIGYCLFLSTEMGLPADNNNKSSSWDSIRELNVSQNLLSLLVIFFNFANFYLFLFTFLSAWGAILLLKFNDQLCHRNTNNSKPTARRSYLLKLRILLLGSEGIFFPILPKNYLNLMKIKVLIILWLWASQRWSLLEKMDQVIDYLMITFSIFLPNLALPFIQKIMNRWSLQ